MRIRTLNYYFCRWVYWNLFNSYNSLSDEKMFRHGTIHNWGTSLKLTVVVDRFQYRHQTQYNIIPKSRKHWKLKKKIICSKLEVTQVWNLPLLPQHSLSDLQSKGFPKGRWHSITNLPMLVPDCAGKVEVIPEMTRFKFWSRRRSA